MYAYAGAATCFKYHIIDSTEGSFSTIYASITHAMLELVVLDEECSMRQIIRESVDSLCRDGADTQYMQYLSKSRITSPQRHKHAKSLFKCPGFLFECLCDQQFTKMYMYLEAVYAS